MICLGAYEYNSNHSNLLGSGAFSYVYKGSVKNNPNEYVAIKIMKKDQNVPKSKTLLSKEINVLKDLNHDNIVQLYDHGISNHGIYLVMEYCNGGDLSEYLAAKGILPEETIRHILIQIGSAMDAIKRKGFMHRDLKPGNILLSHCRDCGQSVNDIPGYLLTFKLADFGFARYLQDGMMAVTMCGSPMYMAPEVLMCRRYDAIADIWSMGVIVYQCLTGKAPFYANNPEALKNIYETTTYLKPKIPVTTSRSLRDLLLRMLVRNPADRIDFEKFLNHPFLHQRHFEPPGSLKPVTPNNSGNRSKREPGLPSIASGPAIKALGHGTGDGPFYMTPRSQRPDRDRTPQRTVPCNEKDLPPQFRGDQTAPSPLPSYNALPGSGNVNTGVSPAYVHPSECNNSSEGPEENDDDDDDVMSRTTVDEYFEDQLDSPALALDPVPPRAYITAIQPHPRAFTGTPTRLIPPVLPSRGSSAIRLPDTTRPAHATAAGGVAPVASRYPATANEICAFAPGNELMMEPHLQDYVIVNPDGSEADRFVRRQPPSQPNQSTQPPNSLISRIVTNPIAYLTGKHQVDQLLPDVTAIRAVPPRPVPSSREPIQSVGQQEPSPTLLPTKHSAYPSTVSNRTGSSSPYNKPQVLAPSADQQPQPCTAPAVTAPPNSRSPVNIDTDGCPGSSKSPPRNPMISNQADLDPRRDVTRAADQHRLHSGGPILDYGGNLHGDMPVGGVWAAAEFSDEQIMDPEHNEEIKTITMVLELCELLTELAERRASVLSDCTVTSPGPQPQHSTPADSPDSDLPPITDPSLPTMKFVSEARRIVEQIVLYRRVLYYLEYVFAQVKKAFQLRRLKSTITARRRLNDCNSLYHRCYIRLCQLVRQSRRDDLIEPVGRLLANITANRLIFDYALVQCQAAEIDDYAGDVIQSLQRYKAGITLIHGLRQHAKSSEDKALLADCMRLLHDRYNHFRTSAVGRPRQRPPDLPAPLSTDVVGGVGGDADSSGAQPPDCIRPTTEVKGTDQSSQAR